MNSRMNVENISRIEVIRGPGSAIYGADAYAGVVNIVTKSASEVNGVQAGVRAGSFDTTDTWVQYGGSLSQEWDLVFNLEHASQDADKSRVVSSDFQSSLDALTGTSASLAPSYLDQRYQETTYNLHISNSRWNIGIDGWIKRDRGLGAGSAQVIDHEGYDDFDQYIVTSAYKNKDLAENWELSANLSYQQSEINANFNIFPNGAVLPIGIDGNINSVMPAGLVLFSDGVLGNPAGEASALQGDIVALFEGWDKHTVRINVGSKEEKLEPSETKNFGPGVIDGTALPPPPALTVVDGTLIDVTGTPYVFITDRSRTVSYVSLQDVWDIYSDWTLTAGVRYDHYSDFGNTTNPRAALVWNTSQNLTSKLLYGRAFRAPSFSELYTINNPVVIGNPDLKPETIDTLELAFAYNMADGLKTGLSIYQYKTEDMIDFVPNGDGSNTAQNIKSLEGMGYELEMDWQINEAWRLLSNYSWQSTKNRSTNIDEPLIPEQQLYVDARWQFVSNWILSTQANWVDDRDRVNFFTGLRENVEGYTLVNLTLRRENVYKNWEFAASVKNVFDEDAVEPSDGRIADNTPLNERSVFAEARYAM